MEIPKPPNQAANFIHGMSGMLLEEACILRKASAHDSPSAACSAQHMKPVYLILLALHKRHRMAESCQLSMPHKASCNSLEPTPGLAPMLVHHPSFQVPTRIPRVVSGRFSGKTRIPGRREAVAVWSQDRVGTEHIGVLFF